MALGRSRSEDIYRELEPFRDSDFSRYYWEAAMGDTLYYLGKAGRLLTCDGIDDFQNNGGRMHAENWRWFRDTGFDPLPLALDYAHKLGLEFHAGYRPAGFAFPPPEDQWNAGGFYEQHPELRAINRDRSLAPRTSYTFPETRRKVLSILREIAEYGVDGIAIIYVRRPPLVGYEPPIVDAFRAETGLDAHELPADDERWLRFRCRVLNEFMREVRAEMDAVAREQGRTRPIDITAMVSGRWDENLLHGQDVAQWVADGTVDTLIPYTMAPELDSGAEAWPDPADADAWIDLVKGTAHEALAQHPAALEERRGLRPQGAPALRRGAESLFFWDCGGQRANFMDQFAWNAIKRLGHRAEILAGRDVGEEHAGARRGGGARLASSPCRPANRAARSSRARSTTSVATTCASGRRGRAAPMPAEPIILSDLGACEPADALSSAPRRGRWRAVPYRSDTFAGTMLVAADATNAPEVRFAHGQTGWHRISFGVLDHWDEITAFEVKLSDDAAFCVISAPGGRHPVFHEVYWKTADVTERDFVFRQLGSTWGQPEDAGDVRFPAARARIAYVRLDPLSADEVAAFVADQRELCAQTAVRPQRLDRLHVADLGPRPRGGPARPRAVPRGRLLAHVLGSRDGRHPVLPGPDRTPPDLGRRRGLPAHRRPRVRRELAPVPRHGVRHAPGRARGDARGSASSSTRATGRRASTSRTPRTRGTPAASTSAIPSCGPSTTTAASRRGSRTRSPRRAASC